MHREGLRRKLPHLPHGLANVSRALSGDIGTDALASVLGTVRTAVSASPDPSLAENVNARFSAIMVRNALEGLKVTVEPAILDLASGVVTYL